MSADHFTGLRGSVRLSENLDRLLVTPSDAGTEPVRLLAAIRSLVGSDVQRASAGVVVPAGQAALLMSAQGRIDLRWTDEAARFARNRGWAQSVHGRVLAEVRRILSGGTAVARSLLADIGNIEALDDHQVVNVAAMVIPDSFGLCIFDEQGAGKTVTALFGFDALVSRDEADFALVVAPKSMVPEWPRDLRRFKGDLYSVQIAAGPRHDKLRALRANPDILVTNYETCVTLEDELRSLLRRRDGRGVLVVDESFFVKNLDAQRTRSIRRLREWCRRAFVLCGTPAPNSPEDLVQQFNIVDFGLTFQGVILPAERQAAAPIVADAVEERGVHVRHLKADVLPHLPPRAFSRLIVPMQPLQREAYAAALHRYVLDLRQSDARSFGRQLTNYLAQRSALLQICSCPETIVRGYAETPGKRLALDSLLNDLVTQRGEKVILWSFFTASIDALVARYARFGPLRYDGQVSATSDRREVVRRFQEEPECRLLIANPAAAGAGLTLHAARIAVFESMSNQPAHYLQSLDRVHRRGQERDVEYVVLLMENSIELAEYDRLLRKEATARQLLGDPDDSAPTRDIMLAEAEQAAQAIGIRP